MNEIRKEKSTTLRDIVALEQVDMLVISGTGRSGSGSNSGSGSGSGSGSRGGTCFFNVLSSIGANYKVRKTPESLGKEYFEGGYGTEYEKENGPDTFKRNTKTGAIVPNPNAYEFINGIFETRDKGWQTRKEKLEEYTTKKKGEKSGKIMGVIDNGPNPGSSHAVIITAFQNDMIEYYDPTYHQRAEVDASRLKYFTMITGAKEKKSNEE